VSRSVSAVLKEAIYKSHSSRVFIVLVEINETTLLEPLRFTSDNVNTISNGNTYTPFPFSISLPDDDEDKIPSTVLQIDNVDRQIAQTLRELDDAPDFTLWVVLDDDPDRIEAGPFTMKLRNARYGLLTVQADIEGPSLLEEPYPAESYNPVDYPAL
jgi:hypothetical protein